MHAAVRTVEMAHKMFLYLCSELQRLVHEVILHQFEHDIRIDGVRVEALIGSLIVRLEFHHGILTHGYVEVFLRFLISEDEGLYAFGGFVLRGVGVNGDEQVGIILIGDVRALLQGDEDVGRTRIDDVHVRVLLLQQPSHFEREGKVEILLLRESSYCPRVLSSVPCIKDDGIGFVGSRS